MRALQFHTFGKPEEVIQCVGIDKIETLPKDNVRIAVDYSPINPADINYMQGTYGVLPELPAVPGMEGTGIVIETNSSSVQMGDRVIFIKQVGAWRSEVVCDSSALFVIPRELDLPADQASMIKVNPLTALRVLKDFVDLEKGDYVIQNAANSSVGQCVIQIAKQLGVKTINLVRREEAKQELLELGADHVLLDEDGVVEKVREICGENLPKLASNAVGGISALRLMDALSDQGSHVTFGAMSMRSLKVPNKFLIFKRITLRGLWVTEWLKESSEDAVAAAYTQISQWVNDGHLTQAVETIYPAEEAKQAVAHAMQSERKGKIIIKF